MNKISKYFAFGIVVILAIFFSYSLIEKPATPPPSEITLPSVQIYILGSETGTTVFDVMQKLASTTSFSFKAKKFPDLGYFIEEINDLKNKNGFWWTLYVNGVYSTAGVSNTFLKKNDTVLWSYKKI